MEAFCREGGQVLLFSWDFFWLLGTFCVEQVEVLFYALVLGSFSDTKHSQMFFRMIVSAFLWCESLRFEEGNVCQGGVSEEHLPRILQWVGAEPVWLPAVSAWTCWLLLLPFHCSFWISRFFAFLEIWNPSQSRTDFFNCKPCWWGGSVALACWHSRPCLCQGASGGQKCPRKCHSYFLKKEGLVEHILHGLEGFSQLVFPLRRARLRSNFVLKSHKQWKNTNTSCRVCKKAR